VDCAEVREALRRDERLSSEETSAHIAQCPACAALLEDGAALGRKLGAALEPTPPPPPEELERLLGAVHGRVAAERGMVAWLRSRSTPMRVVIAIGAVVALCISQLVKPRVDFGVYPTAAMLLEVALYGLMVGAILPLALRRIHIPAIARPMPLALVGAALLLPFVLALRPAVHQAHSASLAGVGAELLPRAAKCFVYGGVFAAVMLLLVWALDRGEHRSVLVAALGAALAGLAGNVALHLHCPITHPEHLLLGHATVGLVLVSAYTAYRAARRPSAAPQQ
jgi:hypothetical protein